MTRLPFAALLPGALALPLLLVAVPVGAADPARPAPSKPAAPATPTATPPAGQESPQSRAADTLKGPTSPSGSWTINAVPDEKGGFAYCVTESRYESGHVLIVGRTKPGAVNLGLRIPGAGLPTGERWQVALTIDDKLKRDITALSAQPDLLIVSLGTDEEAYGLLGSGRELVLRSTSDRIAFQLKGTKKALGDLKTCADKAGAGFAPPRAPTQAALPETLAAILTAAGMRNVQPVDMSKIPPAERPADFAWRHGSVLGGVRERTVEEGAKLPELSATYVKALTDKCTGKPATSLSEPEALPGVTLRTGTVDCALENGGQIHVSLVLYRTEARLFTVFFHEAATGDAAIADQARDNIATVIRGLASKAPPRPPANQQTPTR